MNMAGNERADYERASEEFRSPRAAKAEIIREISLNKVGAAEKREREEGEGEGIAPDPALPLLPPPRAATIARFYAENMHAEHNRNFAKCLPTARISRARLPSPSRGTLVITRNSEVSLTLISIWPACTDA